MFIPHPQICTKPLDILPDYDDSGTLILTKIKHMGKLKRL